MNLLPAALEFEQLWPWLLLPLPALIYCFAPKTSLARDALQVPFFSALQTLEETGTRIQEPHRFGRLLLLSIIWLLCLLAMSRPVLLGEPIPIASKARDLFLAVDISGSMEERDLLLDNRPARRVDVVKRVLSGFIERRQGDRLGLILFADRAYVQAPLTYDTAVVDQLMQEAQLGFAGQKTAIGDAMALGIKQLADRPGESKVMILLTDGASNAGSIAPLEATQVASENNIVVYTIGIGGEANLRSGLFGAAILPPRTRNIDEQTLKQIARQTGGQFFRADNSRELEDIYQVLDELEPVDQQAQVFRPRQQVFFWPLGAALALVALSWFASFLKLPARSA